MSIYTNRKGVVIVEFGSGTVNILPAAIKSNENQRLLLLKTQKQQPVGTIEPANYKTLLEYNPEVILKFDNMEGLEVVINQLIRIKDHMISEQNKMTANKLPTPELMARRLMQEIQYCNGAVDRWNPETYPEDYINKIAPACMKFFGCNPELYNTEDIGNICDGEEQENKDMYGALTGWPELNEALNDYFNNGM